MQNRTKKNPDKCSTEQNNFQTYPKKKKKQKAFSETSFPKAPRRTDKKFNSFQINAVQDKIIFQTYQKKKKNKKAFSETIFH